MDCELICGILVMRWAGEMERQPGGPCNTEWRKCQGNLEEFTELHNIQDVSKELHKASDVFGIEGGKITLQLLLSSMVRLQKCLQKALSLWRRAKRRAAPAPLALVSRMALVANLPGQARELASVLWPLWPGIESHIRKY